MQATYEFPGFVAVYENRATNSQSMWDQGYGIMFHGTQGTLFVNRGRWGILFKMRPRDEETRDQIARLPPEQGARNNDSTLGH